MVTKYDGQGRVVITGEITTATSRADLQTTADSQVQPTATLWETFNNSTTYYGYTNLTWPSLSGSARKVLTVQYYDSYAIIGNTAVNPGSAIFTAPSTAVDTLEQYPDNLPVASLTNVLGTTTYLFSVMHYDLDGRVVKTIKQHYQGGSAAYNKYDNETIQYSFQSLPLSTVRNHYLPSSSSPQIKLNTWNTYDHMNRGILNDEQVDTETLVHLSKSKYNEIGQLSAKLLQSTFWNGQDDSNYIQRSDYAYNSRGWLTKINDPTTTGYYTVFAEQLDYDQLNNGLGGKAQYNGNISTMKWQTQLNPASGQTQEPKSYKFYYDNLNRMLDAQYVSPITGNAKFDETLSYDELGNVLTLERHYNSYATINNNISYNYMDGGNRRSRVMGVTDIGTVGQSLTSTYTYDAMGSLTGDSRKTISGMVYNELNLPDMIPMTVKLFIIYTMQTAQNCSVW